MNDVKIKVKKLVALYKDSPLSNEGLAAYTKAKVLIEKYKLSYDEFGLNDFLAIYDGKANKSSGPKKEEKPSVRDLVKRKVSNTINTVKKAVSEPYNKDECVTYTRKRTIFTKTEMEETTFNFTYKHIPMTQEQKRVMMEIFELVMIINDNFIYSCNLMLFGATGSVDITIYCIRTGETVYSTPHASGNSLKVLIGVRNNLKKFL
jgi:hypothetical protein